MQSGEHRFQTQRLMGDWGWAVNVETVTDWTTELAAVLDTEGDTKLEARMRCINCADMGATYWPDENFGPICERCNALIRPRADTEGDRPAPTTIRAAFLAGWSAGFQEALIEDIHPDQDRESVAWAEWQQSLEAK